MCINKKCDKIMMVKFPLIIMIVPGLFVLGISVIHPVGLGVHLFTLLLIMGFPALYVTLAATDNYEKFF